MSTSSPLKVAVIGLGYFAQFHLRAWERIGAATLVGVADLDGDKVAAVAEQYRVPGFSRLDDMLAAVDPDIVDIVTPPPTHADFIRDALHPGRLIVCQKPFCRTLEEAQSTVAAAADAKTTLVVHENFRFQPWHIKVKSLLEEGLLGQIYQCRFSLRPGDGRGPEAYLDRQPSFQGMERFLVRETAVHLLDVFTWLFGPAKAVYADLRQLNPAIAGEDAGLLILQHDGGVRSVFDGNRLSDHVAANPRKTMGEMVIEGEAGHLRLDGDGRLFFRSFGESTEAEIDFTYEDRDFGGGCVEALNRHLVAYLRDGAPLSNAARDYLPVIALVEAAYQSAQSGKTVHF